MMTQRQMLSRDEWARVAGDAMPPLLALWADTREVYALLREDGREPWLISTAIEAGGYPAMSPARPAAVWFERMIHDLWGHVAAGGTDLGPWLDHGAWPLSTPMALRPGPPGGPAEPSEPQTDMDQAGQIPIGPVHGLIEPAAHLRLMGNGESVARVEARLGYTHKGTLTLMRGKSPRAAARFAARLCAEATVAHAIAFARATERASGVEAPARAVALRIVMAEIERITTHLDVLTTVAEVAEAELLASRCAMHAEALRAATRSAFGHRLMMDCVIPGGVGADIAPGGAEAINRALTPLSAELARIEPLVSLARVRVRWQEIRDSLRLVREGLAMPPEGNVSVPLPPASGEAIGFAAGPHGDIWHWVRLDHGQIASVFMRDAAWLHWPALEAIMANGQFDDLKLVMASFGLSSSGVDL